LSAFELKPLPGFVWSRVTWGRPDSPPSAVCSYCSAAIPTESVPLIMWKPDGHSARFCRACQKTWWGIESFDDPDDDDY